MKKITNQYFNYICDVPWEKGYIHYDQLRSMIFNTG